MTSRVSSDYLLSEEAGLPLENGGRHQWVAAEQAFEARAELPLNVFEPEACEPNYAYPLIIWLHSNGSSEAELTPQMLQISDRNYLGVSLRGPLPDQTGLPGRFSWSSSPAHTRELATAIDVAVERLYDEYLIHPDRIYLAGRQRGGEAAIALSLTHPRRFAGVVAIDARPPRRFSLARFRDMQGLSMLFTGGRIASSYADDRLRHFARLMHLAGVDMTVRQKADLTIRQCGDEINRWIMEQISTAMLCP